MSPIEVACRMPLGEFDLEVELVSQARVTALVGPSGSGKTSLLEVMAGLRAARHARVRVDGCVLTDTAAGRVVPVRERRVGYVPQDLALFPHLSVRQNLLYGRPAPAGSHPGPDYERVVEVLEIGGWVERGVTRLSGGERQRVALARALLSGPRILLLDEPLASLDRPLKARVLDYLGRIRDEFRVPMILVTHDPEEVRALCGHVWELDRGRVVGSRPA